MSLHEIETTFLRARVASLDVYAEFLTREMLPALARGQEAGEVSRVLHALRFRLSLMPEAMELRREPDLPAGLALLHASTAREEMERLVGVFNRHAARFM